MSGHAAVKVIVDLVALDEDITRCEASVAQALDLVERLTAEIARLKPELAATLEQLRASELAQAAPPQTEDLRRSVRRQERRAAHLMRLAERSQRAALTASNELRQRCIDLPLLRGAITSRIPRGTVDRYERALHLGLHPAAVATRGTVCWGCFRALPASVAAALREDHGFVACPHCERVLFQHERAASP